MTPRSEQARKGLLHHIDVDLPPSPFTVPDGVTDVLGVVHHRGAVVGQSWIDPRGREVGEAELETAVRPHLYAVQERRVRERVERVLGRPSVPAAHHSVSVIVCTRDRPGQLRGCLQSLLALNRQGIELLVVDNGSTTPETAAVCAALGVRMIVEPRPGQTSARNAGIANTSGELVAFTDDDVLVDPDWLDELDRDFDDPVVMIATGYIGPGLLDHESQVLFEAHGGFERRADRKVFDPEVIPLVYATSASGAGANMVIRRSLFEEIGGFDEQFGAGTPTRTSDDKLFFYRTLEAGFRIAFDPSRKVWHQHRDSPQALSRIFRDYGTGEFAWSTHVLLTGGDVRAVQVWRWWLRHFVADFVRWRRQAPSAVPPRYTLDEIRGALAAPRALLTVSNRRPAGGPAARSGWSRPSPEPARDVTTERSVDARVVADAPTVTVAIGSYNRCAPLEQVLRQLDHQTMPTDRYEVLVVLDGSTDGSADMVRALDVSYPLRLIEQPNRGLAVGRNVGAAEAAHDIVVFLDDDIRPRPGYVAAHAAAHAERAVDTWVMGYFPPVVGSGLMEQRARTWWEDHFRRKGAVGHRWSMVDMVDGNSSVPARLFERLGGFDEDFTGGRRQDYEMGLRMLSAGVPMAFSRAAVADHHTRSDFRAGLSNGFAEGRYDAVIAKKHPSAWSQMPIAVVPPGRKARLRRAWTEQLGPERCVALGDRLEQLGRRDAWISLFSVAWWGRYLAGFAVGADGAKLGPDPAAVRRTVTFDLEALDAAAVPEQIADVDFLLRRGDRVLARIPALEPGGAQWDWDSVVERATRAVRDADPSAGMQP